MSPLPNEEALLSFRDVATLLSLDESRLRYWSQTGLCGPSARQGSRQFFTFSDLVQVKAAKELVDRGVPVVRVRKSLEALRKALPGLERPLESLRVCSDGDRIAVLGEDVAFEPLTGQVLMEFELASLSSQAARVLGLPGQRAETGASAHAELMSGLAAEDAGDDESAQRFYERALETDARLAAAHTNLGNILHRRGDRDAARQRYEEALAIDPDQHEARFNLANLLDEMGDHELAIAEYRRVVRGAPEFADGHFNLALTLERAGEHDEARRHYGRYLELDREANTWTAAAREALARLEAAPEPNRAGDYSAT